MSKWDEEYREKYFSSPRVKENLARFKVQVRQPKSEEHRQKMSLAKAGRPLSEEHRIALSAAQKVRQCIRRELEQEHPDLSKDELWLLVKEKYAEYQK